MLVHGEGRRTGSSFLVSAADPMSRFADSVTSTALPLTGGSDLSRGAHSVPRAFGVELEAALYAAREVCSPLVRLRSAVRRMAVIGTINERVFGT